MRIAVPLTVLFLLSVSCARHDGQGAEGVSLPRYGGVQSEVVTYSPEDWPTELRADLHYPEARGPHPAVLVVHGGGWERRSREDMTRIARRLARRGFVVMNVDHRFAPQFRFPAQLHDLQVAMHWLHDQAEELDLLPDGIGALGFSSGGHLVSLLAVVAGQGGELDTPHGGIRTRPAAVVAGGAPTDLRKYPGGTLVPQFLGGTQEEMPGKFTVASPVTHVHEKVPPFFFFHGGRDTLVPADHATDMIAALEQKGVHAELYLMRLRGHVSSFLTSRWAIEEGARFLRAHTVSDDTAGATTE